ncbi:MAG: hypothetical protein CM15mP62_25070 [Rhodospirillaceae bacterium]|nr:MAG: hypothetical protein CM15mP62_25070 [Rhodospirillaceae bacterium]
MVAVQPPGNFLKFVLLFHGFASQTGFFGKGGGPPKIVGLGCKTVEEPEGVRIACTNLIPGRPSGFRLPTSTASKTLKHPSAEISQENPRSRFHRVKKNVVTQNDPKGSSTRCPETGGQGLAQKEISRMSTRYLLPIAPPIPFYKTPPGNRFPNQGVAPV